MGGRGELLGAGDAVSDDRSYEGTWDDVAELIARGGVIRPVVKVPDAPQVFTFYFRGSVFGLPDAEPVTGADGEERET